MVTDIRYNIAGYASVTFYLPAEDPFIRGELNQEVSVFLHGESSGQVTTDEYGQYSFSWLYPGTYTAEPKMDGYVFDPAYREATIDSGSLSQLDFISYISTPTSTIQSTVVDSTDNKAIPCATVRYIPEGYKADSALKEVIRQFKWDIKRGAVKLY